MCGRYAASRDAAELVEEFHVERQPDQDLPADYNVAPGKNVYVVDERLDPETGERYRELALARWGLVPSWAKDPRTGYRMINARSETVSEKPAFRRAFARRRCLLPADGYYEWYQPATESTARPDAADPGPGTPGADTGSGSRAGRKPAKQPFFIHPTDGTILAMAGLFEFWHDPAGDRSDRSSWLRTTTILTTAARGDMRIIHDRMPVMVPVGFRSSWLDPEYANPSELLEELRVETTRPGWLTAVPVSRAVNNVRNNGPELIRPEGSG